MAGVQGSQCVAMWSGGGVSERCHLRGGAGKQREGGERGAVDYRHVGHASHIPAGDVLIKGCRIVEHVLVAAHEKEDGA